MTYTYEPEEEEESSWDMLFQSHFHMIARKELKTWQKAFDDVPDLDEQEIKDAINELAATWENPKYNPKLRHVLGVIHGKRLRVLKDDRDKCGLCDDNGWIAFPYRMFRGKMIIGLKFKDGVPMHRDSSSRCICPVGDYFITNDIRSKRGREDARRLAKAVAKWVGEIPYNAPYPLWIYLPNDMKFPAVVKEEEVPF